MAATSNSRQYPEFSASSYQRRILEFVAGSSGNGVVRATAGAGKTSTLLQVAAALPPHLSTCFLAFARDAATELSRRLPASVASMTVHKLGRRTLQRALARRGVHLRTVQRSKYQRLLQSRLAELPLIHSRPEEDAVACSEYLASMAQLARLNLVDTREDEQLRRLALRYGLVIPPAELEGEMHACLRSALRDGMNEALLEGISDFTDMIWLPVVLRIPPPKFDFVCVDEAQDYSSLALAFTLRLVDQTSGGRILFVGDPRQSIYGFAGAGGDALDRIGEQARATILPLSVSYRCPRSHVQLARLISPEIEAAPQARNGRVYWITDSVLQFWAREGDMVLCRANAPLVKTCLRLARAGRQAFVLGRDLRQQLLELGRRAFPDGIVDPGRRFTAFGESERDRLRKRLRGQLHEEFILAERLDLIGCLHHLAQSLAAGPRPPLEALEEHIDRTFGERESAVMLSTVHRAKGKEADRVLILYPEMMPAPYARTEEANQGESCVQFVALTRAKHDLVFVTESGLPAQELLPERGAPGMAGEESVGQGPGAWREVLTLARRMAQRRTAGDAELAGAG